MQGRDVIYYSMPLLEVANQFRRRHYPVDNCHMLQQKLLLQFNQLAEHFTAHKATEHTIDQVQYALAAFLDESILQSDWQHQKQWMGYLMQATLFKESVAGEGFFSRLQELTKNAEKNQASLMIYLLCLQLGFRGKFIDDQGAEINMLVSQLMRQIKKSETPGKKPLDHNNGAPQLPTRKLLVFALILLLIIYLLCYSYLNFYAKQARDQIDHHAQAINIMTWTPINDDE